MSTSARCSETLATPIGAFRLESTVLWSEPRWFQTLASLPWASQAPLGNLSRWYTATFCIAGSSRCCGLQGNELKAIPGLSRAAVDCLQLIFLLGALLGTGVHLHFQRRVFLVRTMRHLGRCGSFDAPQGPDFAFPMQVLSGYTLGHGFCCSTERR